MFIRLPLYNRKGWLDVKHQITDCLSEAFEIKVHLLEMLDCGKYCLYHDNNQKTIIYLCVHSNGAS